MKTSHIEVRILLSVEDRVFYHFRIRGAVKVIGSSVCPVRIRSLLKTCTDIGCSAGYCAVSGSVRRVDVEELISQEVAASAAHTVHTGYEIIVYRPLISKIRIGITCEIAHERSEAAEQICNLRMTITLDCCRLKRHITADVHAEQGAVIGIGNDRVIALDLRYKLRELGHVIFTGLILRHDNDHIDSFIAARNLIEDSLNSVFEILVRAVAVIGHQIDGRVFLSFCICLRHIHSVLINRGDLADLFFIFRGKNLGCIFGQCGLRGFSILHRSSNLLRGVLHQDLVLGSFFHHYLLIRKSIGSTGID